MRRLLGGRVVAARHLGDHLAQVAAAGEPAHERLEHLGRQLELLEHVAVGVDHARSLIGDSPPGTSGALVVSPCRRVPIRPGAVRHPVKTGSAFQPRTVDVCACSALSQSTSHVGEALAAPRRARRGPRGGRGGAQAEVDAVPEREVVVDLAVDVEAVGVGELALVAVGRAVEQQHRAALGHGLAVVLDVAW